LVPAPEFSPTYFVVNISLSKSCNVEQNDDGLNMIIPILKEGETISIIANDYNVLPEWLILDNGINNDFPVLDLILSGL